MLGFVVLSVRQRLLSVSLRWFIGSLWKAYVRGPSGWNGYKEGAVVQSSSHQIGLKINSPWVGKLLRSYGLQLLGTSVSDKGQVGFWA